MKKNKSAVLILLNYGIVVALLLMIAIFSFTSKNFFRTSTMFTILKQVSITGIGVTKIKLMAYGLSGFLAGIAGLVLLSRTSSGQPSAGSGYEMDAITAVVLGGVSLNGGEGKLHMVVIGMLIMGVLTTGMIMCGINDYVQQFVKGIVLILAVAYSEISKKIRSRMIVTE